MPQWNLFPDAICLEEPKSTHSGSTILVVLGSFFALIGSYLLVQMWSEGESSGLLFVLFFACMGLLFIVLGLSQREGASFRIRIDLRQNNISFARSKCFQKNGTFPPDTPLFSFALDQVASIQMHQYTYTMHSSNNEEVPHNVSYEVFPLYLTLHDGTYFWLDSFGEQDLQHTHAQLLADKLHLPIQDNTKTSQAPAPPVHSSPVAFAQINPPEDFSTSFIKGQILPNESKFKIQHQDASITFARFFFFVLPLAVVTFSFSDTPRNMNFFDYWGIAYPVIMGILLLSFWLVVLFLSKQYKFIVNNEYIRVRLDFPWGLGVLFGKEFHIPQRAFRRLQVHRLEDGIFWLTLTFSDDMRVAPPRFLHKLFLNNVVGAHDTRFVTQHQQQLGTHVIGLWSLPDHAQYGKEPTYHDLFFIRQFTHQQHKKATTMEEEKKTHQPET